MPLVQKAYQVNAPPPNPSADGSMPNPFANMQMPDPSADGSMPNPFANMQMPSPPNDGNKTD